MQQNTDQKEKARENVFWDARPGVPNTNHQEFFLARPQGLTGPFLEMTVSYHTT